MTQFFILHSYSEVEYRASGEKVFLLSNTNASLSNILMNKLILSLDLLKFIIKFPKRCVNIESVTNQNNLILNALL